MKILHLYPNLMNLYGDYGNLTILCRHLKDQGIRVEVDKKEVQDNIDISKYDFIYMGSGTERNQLVALKDLMKYQQYIISYAKENKCALFTGNAMELLGKKVGEEKAIGLIDFETEIVEKRYTGDVIVKNEFIGEMVGFINKSSVITGGQESKLFDYVFKDNNLLDNDYEGYRFNNVFGTHMIGPVLVKNPNFLNEIVKLLIGEKFRALKYRHEDDAYDYSLAQLKLRK